MKQKLGVAFGLLLVLSLVLTSCGRKISAEEIVAQVRETVESTENAHGVVVVSMNVGGADRSVKAEVWEKSPDRLRIQILEASEPDLVGVLAVSDGQQIWYYEPAARRVKIGPAEGFNTLRLQEMLGSLQAVIQEVLDVSKAELIGEERVADRDTYKLSLSPQEGHESEFMPGGGTMTVWVDRERWIVLKATYEAGTLGRGSMEVQSFELNPGLPDDLFTFQVPAGVEVVDVEAQKPVHLSLDQAREQAGFRLLVPEYMPEGAPLVDVLKMDGSIILYYEQAPQVAVSIIQGPVWTDPLPAGKSQTVTVRGQQATAITGEAHGNTFLSWTENGGVVVIAGKIGLDEAIKIAESLK